MKVSAAMMWHNEPTEELDAQVRALAGFADHLAAVNGRWNGFPVPDSDTTADECATVIRAASDVGLELSMQSGLTFPGEVAHRNWTLQMAVKGSDWVFLMDADERVLEHKGVRDRLEAQKEDVGTVDFHTADGPEIPLTQWERPGVSTVQRRLFRTKPNLRFETHHWWLQDDDNAYWGEIAGKTFAKAAHTGLQVEHRTCLRPAERWTVKREFSAVRDPADLARGYEF